MSVLKNLRAYANNTMTEAALKKALDDEDSDLSDFDFEGDEDFVNECMSACLPTLIQMELLGETADIMDEATKEAFTKVQEYYIGQGVIDESAKVTISNPKVNVVHLNPKAMMARLSSIITIKMARKDNIKAYKKYKIGQKIKKDNMAEMRKRYGAKADRLAKILYNKNKKGKPAAVVAEQKAKTGK